MEASCTGESPLHYSYTSLGKPRCIGPPAGPPDTPDLNREGRPMGDDSARFSPPRHRWRQIINNNVHWEIVTGWFNNIMKCVKDGSNLSMCLPAAMTTSRFSIFRPTLDGRCWSIEIIKEKYWCEKPINYCNSLSLVILIIPKQKTQQWRPISYLTNKNIIPCSLPQCVNLNYVRYATARQ